MHAFTSPAKSRSMHSSSLVYKKLNSGFPILRGTLLRVPKMRTIVFPNFAKQPFDNCWDGDAVEHVTLEEAT